MNPDDSTAESKKMEILGRLAGPIIHDLNNLLTVMQLNASLLEENLVSGEERQLMIREISRACHSASELTKTMLSVARTKKSDKRSLEARRFTSGLSRLLETLVSKKATLRIGIPEEEIWLDVEYSAMSQVLMNLVLNAVDAAPGGKIDLTVTRTSGLPGRDPALEFGEFSVKDTGCGILPEVIPHIFDPFFTTKEAGKGTGLGLHIVHEAVTQCGGWVEVESKPDAGTVFRVYIPSISKASPPSSAAHPLFNAHPQSPAITTTPGSAILLVEDDPGIRSVAKTILDKAGFQVIESENADEALGIWNAKRDEISLLFVDMVLPGSMNGADFARACLRDRKDIPVLYTSGYGRPEGDSEGGNFIAKPYKPDDLVKTVREMLAAGKISGQ